MTIVCYGATLEVLASGAAAHPVYRAHLYGAVVEVLASGSSGCASDLPCWSTGGRWQTDGVSCCRPQAPAAPHPDGPGPRCTDGAAAPACVLTWTGPTLPAVPGGRRTADGTVVEAPAAPHSSGPGPRGPDGTLLA